jgi:hypothetical protein
MAKILGKGCLLKMSISTVLTTIGQLKSFSWTGVETRYSETTALADNAAVFTPTTNDYGTVEATVYFDPDDTTHAAILTAVGARAAVDWSITTTDATPKVYTFSGILANWSPINDPYSAAVSPWVFAKLMPTATIASN